MSEIIACLAAASETAQRVAHENRLVNRYTARDFTPFRFLSGWGEVPSTHMLAFFLDPDEDHGQGTLFQELFIKRLQLQPAVGARLPKARWKVEAERRHAEYGQLDMLLTAADQSFGICLENKPRNQTIDQPQQLASYRKLLQNRHHENYLLIYLSREARNPSSDSLHPDDRNALTSSGHYINITYRSFILDLLDDWHQAVHPESLRIFLRQFRQHIEQWLQFESTKPAQLMQNQELAETLSSNPSYVHTAFEISSAIPALRAKLLKDISHFLTGNSNEFTGEIHWMYQSFFDATNGKPFLIRRKSLTGLPSELPWGRFSIGLEFDQGKLFFGVRFDKENWFDGDASNAAIPGDANGALNTLIGSESDTWSWWPWRQWAGPQTDQELCQLIAENKLQTKLAPEIKLLADALDKYCAVK